MNTGGSSFWDGGAVPLIEPKFLSSIIAAASDIALVVSDDRKILSVLVSDSVESFGDLSHWEGRSVIEILADDSVEKFQKAHARFLSGDLQVKPIEINHEDTSTWSYPIRYSFHQFGSDNTTLMLGRDLRPIAETQQQLVQAQIALEQGYEAQREFDSRYRVMLSKTNEAVLFANVQDGRISDCSEAAATLLGVGRDAAAGTPFSQLLSDRASAELMESLMNASFAEGGGQIEVTSARTKQRLVVTPSMFRAGGQRILHCELRQAGDVPQIANAELDRAALLFRAASDAIVFSDLNGSIFSTNDSFLDLVGAAHGGDVRGKSLSEYLVRGQIDLGVLVDKAHHSGQMHTFATKLLSELGARLSVEISAAKLDDASGPVLAFVIRDVSRIEGMRGGGTVSVNEDTNRDVMELVGSAPLKDIVAETADVVEKICIETAVKLTKNNRVAAAEMLGLSRQSLYVKLRKFGLLRKE